MKKQKELDRLTKELVKQMTGNEVEDPQEGDYQIAYYYLSKAINYTHSCKTLKDKKEMTFSDWLRENRYKKDETGLFIKEEHYYTYNELLKKYKNTQNL